MASIQVKRATASVVTVTFQQESYSEGQIEFDWETEEMAMFGTDRFFTSFG